MTVIELADEDAAALKAKAADAGLSLEAWLKQLAATKETPPTPRRPNIAERICEIMQDVPSEDFAALPKDGLQQIDHYVYGVPKSAP